MATALLPRLLDSSSLARCYNIPVAPIEIEKRTSAPATSLRKVDFEKYLAGQWFSRTDEEVTNREHQN